MWMMMIKVGRRKGSKGGGAGQIDIWYQDRCAMCLTIRPVLRPGLASCIFLRVLSLVFSYTAGRWGAIESSVCVLDSPGPRLHNQDGPFCPGF
jgi:hypothetical protein